MHSPGAYQVMNVLWMQYAEEDICMSHEEEDT